MNEESCAFLTPSGDLPNRRRAEGSNRAVSGGFSPAAAAAGAAAALRAFPHFFNLLGLRLPASLTITLDKD
jgi:hypothetical protein